MTYGLLRELISAHQRTRDPELAAVLKSCGLPSDGVLIWGISFVEVAGQHYTPRAGGHPAIIVPAFDNGTLMDLTATGLTTRRTVTRTGAAAILGQDAIDNAMESDTALRLFQDPIEWLRNRCDGAVVLDWSVARFTLADLPGIACATDLLAARVNKALRQPLTVPPIYVKEARREAA